MLHRMCSADGRLDFNAMEAFISDILDALQEHGSRAVRVFLPAANVLLVLADRLPVDIVRRRVLPMLLPRSHETRR